MTKTFTENDLLRYIYGETTSNENLEIENSLLCDEQLQEMYNELMSTLGELDKCMKMPSDRAVQNIIDYSKSSNLPSVLK
ncbi:MAG: hypothetical protein AAGC88_06475 [Bacteroidota bacterium]